MLRSPSSSIVVTRKLARRLSMIAVAIAACVPLTVATARVHAQAAGAVTDGNGTPDIPTSALTIQGEVNANDVIVRAGPSEGLGDYPVMKLNAGTRITAVAKRDNWLKIEPPPGAFCLVSQAFVDKVGDGTTGKIINNKATVRVGSILQPQRMHRVPLLLEPGSTVKILGEQEEYYKIAPPQGVYLYVQTASITPGQRMAERPNTGGVTTPGGTTPNVAGPTPPPTTPGGTANATGTGTGTPTPIPSGGTADNHTPADPGNFVVNSTEQNNVRGALNNGVREVAPTTQTAHFDAAKIKALQDRLGELETRYVEASGKPLQDQPLDELNKGYTDLLADEALPPNARRVATLRSQTIKLRQETLASYVATAAAQEAANRRQAELEAEQKELAERVAKTAIKRYVAIGQLANSSIQVGGQPLYRLIDPTSKRTIVYVRQGQQGGADVALSLNQFVGINGQVVADDAMNLTYVQPSAIEPVEAKQVNTRLFADYTPPSLAATNVANTENQ